MRKLGLLIFLAVMLTACGSGQTTTIVLVVTATTAPDVAASPVPPTSAPVTNAPAVSPSVAQQVAASPVPPTATPVTPSPVPPTPTVSVFPTDVKMDIQVAYEDFQH
ncbi:MAG TPA: hypothetical protein VMT34_06205, partial [Aggregatilineales bacterium]|nr:hypothetical protein [Aggregatilineales bacterium]